jgi:hypothetical protein
MAYDLKQMAKQLGNPIYDEQNPESMKEFADAFEQTEPGQRFFKMYGPDVIEDQWDFVVEKFKKVYGDQEITLGDFAQFVDALILSGGLQKVAPPAPKEKKLSSSQLAWQEHRIFSESHSMNECRARAASDPGYASFMRLNTERELAEHQNPDFDPISLNANRSATTQFVSADLQTFASEYKTMPMQKVRNLSNPGTNPLGKVGADRFNAMMNKCFELGLV